MSGVFSILIILVCALLILIVLVQNSKGGGLSSSFASNNQIMGVRKTADFLEKATWGFAIALFVLSLLATPKKEVAAESTDAATEGSVTRKKQEGMVTAPVAAPQQNPVAQPQPANPTANPVTPPPSDKKP
jgi:preprotein translocase subunit SecG